MFFWDRAGPGEVLCPKGNRTEHDKLTLKRKSYSGSKRVEVSEHKEESTSCQGWEWGGQRAVDSRIRHRQSVTAQSSMQQAVLTHAAVRWVVDERIWTRRERANSEVWQVPAQFGLIGGDRKAVPWQSPDDSDWLWLEFSRGPRQNEHNRPRRIQSELILVNLFCGACDLK